MFKSKRIGVALGSLACLALVSCQSGSGKYGQSVVVDRIAGLDETPEWATVTTSMIEKDNQVIYIEIMDMEADSRESACMSSAEIKARSNFLKYIKENITSSGQLNEMSTSGDPGYESLIAFLSQGSLSGAKTLGRYWERVEKSDSTGQRVLRLRCAAQVGIARNVLQKQLNDVINKAEGNPDIRKKLIDAQQKFIENVGK